MKERGEKRRGPGEVAAATAAAAAEASGLVMTARCQNDRGASTTRARHGREEKTDVRHPGHRKISANRETFAQETR